MLSIFAVFYKYHDHFDDGVSSMSDLITNFPSKGEIYNSPAFAGRFLIDPFIPTLWMTIPEGCFKSN